MKKIVSYFEYGGIKDMFPHLFDETYSGYSVMNRFKELFPEELQKWERAMSGGNRGAHCLIPHDLYEKDN